MSIKCNLHRLMQGYQNGNDLIVSYTSASILSSHILHPRRDENTHPGNSSRNSHLYFILTRETQVENLNM